MKYKLFFVFVILLFCIGNIVALGLTPARTTVNFEPNLKRTVIFSVVNSEKADLNLDVYTRGELSSSISLERNSLVLGKDESSREVSYNFNLPEKLSPGLHTAEIIVAQPPNGENGDSYVGATLAVATQLYVIVPYPGKYAEADVNILTRDGETRVIIPVSNLGEFDLVSVKANIDIFDENGEKIKSFNTGEVSIKTKEKKEIIGIVTPSLIGNYRAVVTLLYDGETLNIEKRFSSFEQELELQQISIDNFNLGQIAKFEMLVENYKNAEIKNVYSQTNIFNSNGELMADFKSQTYDISAKSKKLLTSYWDTKGVKEGTYNSKVYLKYADQSFEKQLKFEVLQNEIRVIGLGYVISQQAGSDNSLITILVIIIIILVLVNLAWFFFFRKKLKK